MEETVLHFHPEMNRGERPKQKRQYYAWKAVRATIEATCSSGSRLRCRARSRGMGDTLPLQLKGSWRNGFTRCEHTTCPWQRSC
ncbi:hypothetical protein PF008_g10228 [Phytophthora fragariae]|uniref:Uncharacterized protein n=1 Tax=Phytophthora fragariae TaxID=53985 RepID=A0A6G0RUH6_9STRA|nr:hypothetical protein PF008_g10228 [Phytophthora fragariae]